MGTTEARLECLRLALEIAKLNYEPGQLDIQAKAEELWGWSVGKTNYPGANK